MAQGLAAYTPLSDCVKSRDKRPTSRTITALLAAVGTGCAVFAMIGAPIAVAQSCRTDQVWLNGECTYPPGDSGGPRLTTVNGPPRNSTGCHPVAVGVCA